MPLAFENILGQGARQGSRSAVPDCRGTSHRPEAPQPGPRIQPPAGLLRRAFRIPRAHAVPPKQKSVAVLYFENQSGAKEDEYFRDGITEDIVTELSKIAKLQIFPRSEMLAFRDKPVTALQVGQQLDAALRARRHPSAAPATACASPRSSWKLPPGTRYGPSATTGNWRMCSPSRRKSRGASRRPCASRLRRRKKKPSRASRRKTRRRTIFICAAGATRAARTWTTAYRCSNRPSSLTRISHWHTPALATCAGACMRFASKTRNGLSGGWPPATVPRLLHLTCRRF